MRTSRGGPFPVGPWQANDIVIDQKSHVFNANLQLGPGRMEFDYRFAE